MTVQPTRRAFGAGAWAVVLSAGCSGTVVASPDANTTTTQALISVERIGPAADSAGLTRAHASAHFLRLALGADDSVAARLVGAALELPPLGACERVEALSDPGMALASVGTIDLVDVGEVAIEAGAARATLAARAFPDVVDLVSGVVYTTRDVADPLPANGPYRFHVSGSWAITPVAIEARAPGAPEDVLLGGMPLGAEDVTLVRGDLPVVWRGGTAQDVVYVDLVANDDRAPSRVRCAFADTGAGVVPAAALPTASNQTISVHRIHRETVAGAGGLDRAEVRFDLATVGRLQFVSTERAALPALGVPASEPPAER